MSLVQDAATELSERGFTMEQVLTDQYGRIGYLLSFVGQKYVLVAKEYAYDNLASFIARLVVHALPEFDFIFYCHDDGGYTVFDGQYLREHADESQGESKQRDCSWLELDRSYGADLDEFIRGRESPATLAGDNQTLETFA